jgi:hypothetical protein
MPFKHGVSNEVGELSQAELDAQMAGIGLNFAVEPNPDADIERTLLAAAQLGMEGGDLRVLGVLVMWWQEHHTYVHANRLIQFALQHRTLRLDALWSALAQLTAHDRRFAKLKALASAEQRVELLPVGNAFQLMRRGEDVRFVQSALAVPAGTLRERAGDILSREVLVRQHPGYKHRVQFGPTWRADLWTVLTKQPTLTTAQAARVVGCAFSTAWPIVRDFHLLNGRLVDGLQGQEATRLPNAPR